ncbi:MAG: hypothetical protein ABIG84_03770 [archaeon]
MSLHNYIERHIVDLPKHILSIEDLTIGQINYIFGLTDELKENPDISEYYDILKEKCVFSHFEEASSRTRLSSERAAYDLGVFGNHLGPGESSVEKGEILEDIVNTYETNKANILVIRGDYDLKYQLTEEQLINCKTRLINAGDKREHPTQALLDLYLLMKKANVDDIRDLNLDVVFVGHTNGYRAAQSLVKGLTKYTRCNVSNILPVGGEAMGMEWGLKNVVKLKVYPYPYVTELENIDIDNIKELEVYNEEDAQSIDRWLIKGDELEMFISSRKQYQEKLAEGIKNADVLYFCRSTNKGDPAIVHGLTPRFVDENAKDTMSIMHPRPIGCKELDRRFDNTKRDFYTYAQPIAGYDVRKALFFAMLIEDNLLNNTYQATLEDFV